MQKLQDSVFSIVKTTNLSSAVFTFLQPSKDFEDKTPLGGILKDTKHGWLALGPKFCVVNLRTGLKVAARTFGTSNFHLSVTSVIELPTPLTNNSQQLLISLQSEDTGLICVLHINGSQILRCIQTDVVVTEMAVCDAVPDGVLTCFDGIVMAGTKTGEIFAFDLNRACLVQALKDISQGYDHLILNEANPANVSFLPLNALNRIEEQRDLAVENDHHLAILLNENSMVDKQYIFWNPDGSIRMKAKVDHVRVTVLQYIPQLASFAVGFNFGAFQIWNLLTLDLEYTSQVNIECLPVTQFGFQEPCDDPRAFCYLWVIFSVLDRLEEEEFPLAVMYSLTYQGKRMLSDTKCLYQEFSSATLRFQIELGTNSDNGSLLGGKCVSCHTYSINSTLGDEGEDSMLNICQLVWECWGENVNSSTQYGMLLFDLDQWYKDQMPATQRLESNAFMSCTFCSELGGGACVALDVRLDPASVAVYSHATRLEEHFYPNSLQYNCICLNTSEAGVLRTVGIQRQLISSLDAAGPTALLLPARLYVACLAAGLAPLYCHTYGRTLTAEEQRRFLLSVALEARLSRFLKRCAHDWATGSHAGVGCTLTFLVDWCWKRAIELKENAKELTAPLFASAALPDRNVVRCLEHCVQQLTQLTGLLDAVLTKCCNLVVPDALNEMEEKYKGIGTVSLYFQVVQWFLRVGLLPERHDGYTALPYPARSLRDTYDKRRLKLNRLQDQQDDGSSKSCSLLYIDQLLEHEFEGERIHQTWIKGGSETGLYPPPSLYSLLRLYLLPDIAEEHKHSLVLYLLVDYSMVYDDVRHEAVIRRLMQFPTMFGLSNTAIKATQAFWHLDHRDFDFALDQLQCLTGNTLSEWQHNVVLSSLLAQKKTQAALQYLHVRKPAPIQNLTGDLNCSNNKVNEHDKLDDWHACCHLYLARGLVYEALDVVRTCVQNAATVEDKLHVLNVFFKGCRNTGNLSKILQVVLLPLEEEVFITYLENCGEAQTSDLLIMYYLQQSRYLEAERYNARLKASKPAPKDINTSMESLLEAAERAAARDALLEVVCGSLPPIATCVARVAMDKKDLQPRVLTPKPMSVFIQANSAKNKFTYKSSFIQDTIENASETWMYRPKTRKGLKRALDIEETPFICTPKLMRTRSALSPSQTADATPAKRAKLELAGTPRTPKPGAGKLADSLGRQMATLLDMPEVQSPDMKLYPDRADTPHSILKIRRSERDEAPSPVDSRYLGDSDDELLETASNHTHYSDSTNKHLRFTIPTASESGSTPSPVSTPAANFTAIEVENEREPSISTPRENKMDESTDSFATTTSHAMNENHPHESPPKKIATEDKILTRKSFKDNVRARRSLSISANSSLSEDPNTSIESIADIPVTLINPRYSGERNRRQDHSVIEIHSETINDTTEMKDEIVMGVKEVERLEVPRTPRSRRGIRSLGGESTPLSNRSRSTTPERQDSPMVTPMRNKTRSRSRTPSVSPRSSPLPPIPEQPRREADSAPHAERTTLSVPRQLRSRSRTPERIEKSVIESPRLEAIKESPTKSSGSGSSSSSPGHRSLRSRSRTPEVEIVQEEVKTSPRSLRSRSKTPEKLMSPKKEQSVRAKKSLSRIVLEANTFAKTKQVLEKMESEIIEITETAIECTPMKAVKQAPGLMDVTFSPIVNKSILQSSNDSVMSETIKEDNAVDKSTTELGLVSLPAFTTLHEANFEKSVLHSYQSSVGETSQNITEDKVVDRSEVASEAKLKPLPSFTTLNETDFQKSVLDSYESSAAEATRSIDETADKDVEKADKHMSKPFAAFAAMIEKDFETSVLKSQNTTVAETSQCASCESSKDNLGDKAPNVSSLLTDDSDVEMKDAVIQKEKDKIKELEMEINEFEKDMSNEDSDQSDITSSSDDDVEAEVTDSDAPTSNELSDSESDSESSKSSGELQIDEQSTNEETTPEAENIVEMNVEEEVQVAEESKVTETGNETADPLNQGQISLMTDDNSANETDQSISLNYSGEKKEEEEKTTTDTMDKPVIALKPVPANIETAPTTVQTDIVEPMEIPEDISKEKVSQFSTSELPKEVAVKTNIETKENVDIIEIGEAEKESVKVVEKLKKEGEIKSVVYESAESAKGSNIAMEQEPEKPKGESAKEIKTAMEQELKESAKNREPLMVQKTDKSKESFKESVTTMEQVPEKSKDVSELEQSSKCAPEKEIPATSSRKRTKSTSSNKSSKDLVATEVRTPSTRPRGKATKTEAEETNEPQEDEPKTPATRKRTQSTASEDKTPENATPSRRRPKTPTSADVRKIITRRVSREMSEKPDDSRELDESVSLTPKRRSTRARSKTIDDNESVASGSSVTSTRSKTNEIGDAKAAPIRKGRRSILSTKPDLSVIPETTAEEASKKDDAQEVINEYSSSRRLTRHQKAVLESWLEPPRPSPRRGSTASRTSLAGSEHSEDEVPFAFDAQAMERINLLNKTDFEGSPDREELQPDAWDVESVGSDASKIKSRASRAGSEAKSVTRSNKGIRRPSTDVGEDRPHTPGGADSPARGRRASFNRACEALHTPKGRRASVDQRKGDSPPASPATSEADAPATPARRPRRASTHSATSQAKSDSGRRSKKMPTVDEDTDKK